MKKRYLTAVFEYEEGAELPKAITDAFKSDSMMYKDAKVTAVSLEDDISRCEQLESQLEGHLK